GTSNNRSNNAGTRGGKINNPRSTPPWHLSKNNFINGTVPYHRDMGLLCLQCGQIGHTKTSFAEQPLVNWEQTYLKELLWPPMNANFAGHTLPDGMLRYRDIYDSQWANGPTNDQVRSVSGEWRKSYSTEKQNLIGKDKSGDWRDSSSKPIAKDSYVSGSKTSEIDFEIFTGISGANMKMNQNQSFSVIIGFESLKQGKEALNQKEKSVRIDEGADMVPIALDSFLNEEDVRKRRRPIEIDDLLNKEQENIKFRKVEQKKRRRTLRQLKEILGRQGKGPIDYQKLAEDIKVEVSLMDLFQISPDLSKAFRSLSTRVNKRSEKTNGPRTKPAFSADAKLYHHTMIEERSNSERRSLITIEQKAFRVPVSIKTFRDGKEVNVKLPTNVAQADQGSDMITVTVGLLKALGLPMKTLTSRGFDGMTMNVADGTSAQLTHYASFELGV
ncbi:hypothetical protein EPUL_006695, partial [Erysiphe pulchra]